MQEFQCCKCMNTFLVEKRFQPSPSPSKIIHCPFCGAEDIVMKQFQVDRYWFDLSESLGFGRSIKGADITQKLYATWEPSEFRRFSEYIDSIRPEIQELLV